MAADALGTKLAPAKVNLSLHLCGQRADGYHLLDSLVVFPGTGDVISAEASGRVSLTVSGPFSDALDADGDNLVMRAATALAQHHGIAEGVALHLEKNLPVASGIGGGSSDAAAALALLADLWGCEVPEGLALWLGADVPVCCRAPAAQIMRGIGDDLSPAPRIPDCWMVLVNPGIGVATREVFANTADKAKGPGPAMPAHGFTDFEGFAGWLGAQRNDLQAAAVALCPPIGDVLLALDRAPVARMSGSGATCFGLFATEGEAHGLADPLRKQTGWWISVAPVAPR